MQESQHVHRATAVILLIYTIKPDKAVSKNMKTPAKTDHSNL